MNINDPKMTARMEKALRLGDNVYSFADVQEGLKSGNMQGHVEGKTWAITQIHDWPQKRVVNILFVVGVIEDLEDIERLEKKIETWAVSIGADIVTAVGREGWWHLRTPGWKKTGVLYSKDLHNEQR